jgi:hypothetical protein
MIFNNNGLFELLHSTDNAVVTDQPITYFHSFSPIFEHQM